MGDTLTQAPQVDRAETAEAEQSPSRAKPPSPAYYAPHGMSLAGASSPDDIPLTRNNLLFLQRAVGNREVARLLQRKGKISRASDDYVREAAPVAAPVVQRQPQPPENPAGLSPLSRASFFSQPTRALKRTDDELLTNAGSGKQPVGIMPTIQRKCACGGNAGAHKECDDCQARRQLVQRQAEANEAAEQEGLPSSVTDVVQAHGGEPLPRATRESMESALGTDLGAVRIHTGPQVARAAQDINAEAFTQGQDIYFGAGRYELETTGGRKLLAHELAHTIQQRSGVVGPARVAGYSVSQPDDPQEIEAEAVANRVVSGDAASHISQSASGPGHIHRYSWEEFEDDLSSAGESVADVAGDVGSAVVSGAEFVGGAVVEGAQAVGGTVVEGAQAVGGAVVEGARAVGGAVVEGAGAVVEAGGQAFDWLATEAGQLAAEIADAFGVPVRITAAGLEIIVPAYCPIEAIPLDFDLPKLDKDFMVPVFAVPIGPDIFISGEIGLTGSIAPRIELQIGPVCLNGIYILINPFTNDYSISGGLSATAAMALSAKLQGGVRGELSLSAIIPVGPIPVPISVPLIAAEGGLAGIVRGIGAATLTMSGGLSMSGDTVTMVQSRQLDMGVAADLFAGAYAQLDVLGEKICRIYWQPYEWHGGIAFSLAASTDLTIAAGGSPAIIIGIDPPAIDQIPFDRIPLAISREGFSDDCPITDRLCSILEELNLLPSQNGGEWNWSGPYGPGSRLDGPLEVYEKDPGFASGSECRGACGPDCITCESNPVHRHTDPETGEVWEYTNFQDCNSNEGCRAHDAAFDWAAAEKGEIGSGAIVMPWHMAASIECLCNNLGGNCIAWIAGLPPFDSKMYFADSAAPVTGDGGGVVGATGACKEQHPGAIACTEPNSDRDAVLARWGAPNKVGNFRDFRVFKEFPSNETEACDGAAGKLWYCTATDLVLEETLTVSIHECECCKDDGTFGSEWTDPHEVHGILRIDDAPIYDSFRHMYNRIDSWYFFIKSKHPELLDDFNEKFEVEDLRAEWLSEIKERGEEYKNNFRNVARHDVEEVKREYREFVLGKIEQKIKDLTYEIAVWYQEKTGNDEPIEDLQDRVHREGTEIWREAWRRAILQVDSVLDRLWPPAKAEILGWLDRKRDEYPNIDLTGEVGELAYIGSLASGTKSPAKQYTRFNPQKFDVDANVEAPPLAKYAMAVDNLKPKHERIFGRATTIDPLNRFSEATHTELVEQVPGYEDNPDDPFDVVIKAPELPEQKRFREATERLYGLRRRLDEPTYSNMIEELKAAELVVENEKLRRWEVRADLTPAQFQQITEIMDRYEPQQ
ncbi:MAG TPA: DUF4157 domain-containing protein [Pyrinomonadaceae bacterium]|jgi:hypothetical protein|nr:DUF4157 domain-containing protein [Pyrinomonadaceae bacterium]